MSKITGPISLYKHLLRCIRQLPPEAQSYYKHHVKQAYNSHSDENDQERIQQIIERAVDDSSWVLEKYSNKKN